MGVHRGVPLAGKMLGAGRKPVLLHGGDPRRAHLRHQSPILPVGTYADVGAVSLGQDIEHRRQVHIQPQPAQFLGLDLTLPGGIGDVFSSPQGQIVREHGNAVPEHDDPPPFMIRHHQ